MHNELPAMSGVKEKSKLVASGMALESTSTNANDSQSPAPIGRMVSSSEQPLHFETIDLTSDQEDVAYTLNSGRNDNEQTQRNVRRQKVHEAKTSRNQTQQKRKVSAFYGTVSSQRITHIAFLD